MTNILVLFGGVSPEHDISLRSAETVLRHLPGGDRAILPVGITKTGQWLLWGGEDLAEIANGNWERDPHNRRAFLSPERGAGLCVLGDGAPEFLPVDVVFPVLHGENGEDGTIQGLLKLSGIPFVGCGVAASAMAMDKTVTKLVAATTGVRQAKWLTLARRDFARDSERMCSQIADTLGFPVFIKPAGTGSSVGVSKVKTFDKLKDALQKAFSFDSKILAEEFIDGREIEVAVLGNAEPATAAAGEIDSGAEFYDFDAKYVSTESKTLIPAPIDGETMHAVEGWAQKIYLALGCEGLSRVDFFLERGTGEIVFNEINTLPGFTSISMYPKMWENEGLSLERLLTRLLELAKEE